MLAFPVAYLTLILLSVATRNGASGWTAVMLMANWCFNSAAVWVTGDVSPAVIFGVADYLTALFLFLLCGGWWCRAIMLIYVAEIVAHVAYFGLTDRSQWPAFYYYFALYYLAWAQVAVCGGWIGWNFARNRGWLDRSATYRGSSPVAAPEPRT